MRGGLAPDEIALARRQRRLRASWSAIGAMLGRNGDDVRRQMEAIEAATAQVVAPAPAPPPAPVAVPAATPKAKPKRKPGRPRKAKRRAAKRISPPVARCSGLQARALAVLGQRPFPLGDVADRIGRGVQQTAHVLRRLVEKGLVLRQGDDRIGSMWGLSRAGWRELRRHEAMAEAKAQRAAA